MARSGRDPAQFARDLLAHLRHLLVTQTVGEVPETFVVTATDEGRLAAQAEAIGAATLVRTIDELAAALTAVREGDDARMAVEIALLKAAPARPGSRRPRGCCGGSSGSREDSEAVGPRVLSPQGTPPPPPVARASSGAVAPDDATRGSYRRPRTTPARTPPMPDPAPAEAATGGASAERQLRRSPSPDEPRGVRPRRRGGLRLEEISRVWPAVLDQLRQTAPALAATFEGARPVGFERRGKRADRLPGRSHLQQAQGRGARQARAAGREALETVTGQRLRPGYVLLDGEAGSGGGRVGRAGPRRSITRRWWRR